MLQKFLFLIYKYINFIFSYKIHASNVSNASNASNASNESNESNESNASNASNASNESNEKSLLYYKQKRYDEKYLEIAQKISELSYATKKKVGSIIVKNSMIISDGYNGTPTNFENKCEDEYGNTKWYTLHSEANAITKLVKNGISAEGATLYITLSPCKECSKLILQSGIKKVIYLEKYKDLTGIQFLKNANINVCQFVKE